MYKCISTIVVLGVLNGAPALAETYDAAEFPLPQQTSDTCHNSR